ncbi:hypothetical protein ACFV1C_03095 [Streptomyces sp. NPDC059605]|uniref:hypothetical protein n=1 Tax=unclassified Streptomyces TaxID=2593676 RepID=UPI0036CC9487
MPDGPAEANAKPLRGRARVEHAFACMKHYKIFRDCHQRHDGPRHAVQAVTPMHNPTLTA